MKKYLMFAMDQYYPCGGWNDMVGSFDTMEEVQAKWDEFLQGKVYEFAHIVDTNKGCIVGKYYQRDGSVMTEIYD